MPGRVTICFPFTGDVVGGSHISVRGLVDGLDPSQFRILVVPQVAGGNVARLFEGHEIIRSPERNGPTFRPGAPFGPAQMARTTRGLMKKAAFLKRYEVDIVHTNDGRTHASWGIAARMAGTRLIWHHRGDPGARGLRLLAPLVADHVLAVSTFSLPPPGLWSAARRAEVLHSPFETRIQVDRTAARAALLRELDLPPDTLVLGYFGSFIHRKRPFGFVDVVSLVRAGLDRPVVGVMFGEAEDSRTDERLRRHADRGDVRLMGYRTPGHDWIAACDQLLVPAVGEPFGRTLIEAMLVGTPVIAARSGGNVEALEDGRIGILVEPDNAREMAEAATALAQRPARAADLTAMARESALSRFGTERHAGRVAELYTLLARRDGRGEARVASTA